MSEHDESYGWGGNKSFLMRIFGKKKKNTPDKKEGDEATTKLLEKLEKGEAEGQNR